MTTPSPGLRCLVLQHLAVEHPGSLGWFLADAGVELVTVELDAGTTLPALEPFDLMVVMGGPMDVWDEGRLEWLATEKAAIRRWVRDLARPFLGVCLGHQLLADALGGEVAPMARPEVGVNEMVLTDQAAADPMFSGLAPRLFGLAWHGSEVRALPSDAVLLATNDACSVQAFRAGPAAWGIQFHVEVWDRIVAEWSAVPSYRRALERTGAADAVATGVTTHLALMTAVAERLASRLVALAGAGRRGAAGAAGAAATLR